MNKLRRGLFLIMFIPLLWQCNTPGPPLYRHIHSFDTIVWHADSTISFSFSIQNTIVPYDIGIQIQHEPTYLFRNLYLFITMTTPDGHAKTDTVNAVMADSKGRWFGEEDNEDIRLALYYRRHIMLSHKGVYHITIAQAMRDTLLSGIKSIGVEVRQSKLKK